MNKSRVALAAAAALAPGSAGLATAQTKPTTPSNTQTVFVTSQKRKDDIRPVPLSVSVLSGEAFKDNQISDFSSLSRNIPNLSYSSQAGAGLATLEIRGVSSQAGSATLAV